MRIVRLTLLASVLLLAFTCCQAKVRQYRVEVVKEYPHDTSAYTQGLFFHDGKLFESTGQYGHSSLRIVDLNSGEPLKLVSFTKKYFMEGSVILGDCLYLLTWTNRVVFIYDAATLEYRSAFSYPRDGWGLTTDGERLIASDGTADLYFMKTDFTVERRVTVKMNGRPVRFLNELEYIDGKIWANVYTTDLIVIINPQSGEVEGSVDVSGLLPDRLRSSSTDVLNGIAQNPADGKIYLTGKYWPRLYEVRLVEVK